MKFNIERTYRRNVPKHMDKQRLWEELMQAANVEGILRRAVQSSRSRTVVRHETLGGHAWSRRAPPRFPVKIKAVAQNQILDGPAEYCEKLRLSDVH